ncbi:sigma-54-dependent transcriptional regulator [Desulfosoma caldarium]|uniref:Two-component system NtrC family response regulator n=1 Tax=Desulfosoma caldarium TaxID=610254 RepID=A0A3N1VIF5_9BACT|nr:sigma-54 dependent transcriptional regulator [Desulfosoma caldarium]ROR01690.1 two-component system NtrC family response regulator [Desulfosoma caldarium]
MQQPKVLVVDDDPWVRDTLKDILEGVSCVVECAGGLGEGKTRAAAMAFDIVFLDVVLPDGSGLEAIEAFRSSLGRPEVLIMTGKASADGAALALRHGAWNYLSKPLNIDDVQLAVAQVVEYRRSGGWFPTSVLRLPDFVATSDTMVECLHGVARAAASQVPVLIVGETGTGKERLARAIHEHSARASKPFVVVDCTVIPEPLMESHLFGHEKGAFTGADRQRVGLVALAHRGTLFLDEVGDLPQSAQAKLLRVIQEKTFRPVGAGDERYVDFRPIAATHRNLEKMVQEGRFRQDLYYRLAGMVLRVPPLRRRKKDIVPIVQDVLLRQTESSAGELKGLSPDFVETILSYSWPGNVRELIHAVLHALAMSAESPTLYAIHLPEHIRAQVAAKNLGHPLPSAEPGMTPPMVPPAAPTSSFHQLTEEAWPTYKAYREKVTAEATRTYLDALMKRSRGDVARACALSGLSRSRLYALLKEAGLGVPSSCDATKPSSP